MRTLTLERPRGRSVERGVAMVEFTVVLPLVLALILGVTEIGRAMIRYNALTKAVQDGARYAASLALRGTTGTVNVDPQLEADVRNLVAFGNTAGSGNPVIDGLAPGQVTIVQTAPQEIRVDASYPYQLLIGPTIPFFGLGSSTITSFNMQASVTMRAL
jgi:Flp pilus assembly protein TadG